jgi:hypothetical protein
MFFVRNQRAVNVMDWQQKLKILRGSIGDAFILLPFVD